MLYLITLILLPPAPAACFPSFQYSSSSSSSSRSSSSTISSSTGSRPTISSSVPHSSHAPISPLSASLSTWTSASHSGHVPVGTFLLLRVDDDVEAQPNPPPGEPPPDYSV